MNILGLAESLVKKKVHGHFMNEGENQQAQSMFNHTLILLTMLPIPPREQYGCPIRSSGGHLSSWDHSGLQKGLILYFNEIARPNHWPEDDRQ